MASKMEGLKRSIWQVFGELSQEINPLDLGRGFPDFAPPECVRNALAQSALDKNICHYQYTRDFGHPRLVEALAKLYSRELGRELDAYHEIIITGGAYQALYVTISGMVNTGDEVIIIEPFFDCYAPQVQISGGVPVYVSLRPRKSGKMSSGDWKLDENELRKAFTHKTKAILINTPNNPLGKIFSKDELSVIADLCKEFDAIAIMDEVYEWMTYDQNKHVRMATLPGMWDRTITIGSAGKTFSVTGWKTGWLIGSKKLLDGIKINHQYCVGSCVTPIQEAIARAFETELERIQSPDCYFKSLAVELQGKRDRLVQILEESELTPIVPEGGYFILADISQIMQKIDIGGDRKETKDLRFAKWLCRTYKLQGIPPSYFYSASHRSQGKIYIRFCFIKEDDNIEKAGKILSTLQKDIAEGKYD